MGYSKKQIKDMDDMTLFRFLWRKIVKNNAFHKPDASPIAYNEIVSRKWDFDCLYCQRHQHCEGCPLMEKFGPSSISTQNCVPPFYDWIEHHDINGAKKILEVIERDWKKEHKEVE